MASPDVVSLETELTRAVPARTAARRGAAALAWPFAVAAAVYAALLSVGERLLNDPDTFWHIAAGRWIWVHGAVPTTDPFSHTLAGAPWVAHEWLAELILAACYGALGWTGVVGLVALAAAGALALLMRALLRAVEPKFALIAVAMSFLLAAPHLVARPHVLAMPLMVAWVAGLARARAEDRAPTPALLPLMALWANLHGGFIVGLALTGAFAVEAALAARDAAARWDALRRWGWFLAGALAASVLTPHGIEGWVFPLRLMGLGFSLAYVGEWHSPDFERFQPIEVWLLGLLALGFIARVRLPPVRMAVLALLIHLALGHVRNGELLALIGPLILAEPFARALGRGPAPEPVCARPVAMTASAILMAAITALMVGRGFAHDDPHIAPRAALAAAERAGLAGPVLNDYDFGGYLIFSGIPPFVDGRIDLYGDAFMRDYADALAAKGDALLRLLERYKVNWALLAPGTAAVAVLDRLPGWERVYADEAAVVHRRRPDEAPAAP